jgi:diacylglycerol kinase (ATP)
MTPLPPGATGLRRIVLATGHSLAGLRAAYTGENAFRQEVWLAALLLPASFWVGRSWLEVAVLAASVMLVLIVELLNSGIEAAIDRISLDRHPLSKRAKDLGSAAVFLAVLTCGAIWLSALWWRVGA